MPAQSISRSRWLRGHNRPSAAIVRFVAAAIVIVTIALAAGHAGADQTLLLEMVVNGRPVGKIGQFVQRDSELLASPAELRDLGIRVPDRVPSNQGDLVPLSTIEGLSVRLDMATQTLYVTAAPERLLPELLLAPGVSGANVRVESGIGATLDYDVVGTSVGGQNLGSGLFDLRAFSPWGVVSSGLLGYAGANSGNTGPYSAIRLDSVYTYADVDNLRWYRAGDFINGGLGWTRPVRIGGLQIQSDFTMRPDLVTFPLPSVGGSTAVPSTVDVLINGTRVLSRQVAPGPFEIPQLPVVTGGGAIQMSVTNALGQQVTTTLPFYASSNLLAPGLQTYSAEVGAVRRNWGVVSDDYGALAGSATYRRGLSSMVTVEAHAEGTAGLVAGGAGGVVNVGDLAVLNFSAAGSGLDLPGVQLAAGLQRLGPIVSLGAFASIATRNFRDIATVNGDPVPQHQVNAYASLSFGRFGSAGISFTGIDRSAVSAPINLVAPVTGFLAQNTVLPGGTISTTSGAAFFIPVLRARILVS